MASVLDGEFDLQMLLDLPPVSLQRAASPEGLDAPAPKRARADTFAELRLKRDHILVDLLLNGPLPHIAPFVAAPTTGAVTTIPTTPVVEPPPVATMTPICSLCPSPPKAQAESVGIDLLPGRRTEQWHKYAQKRVSDGSSAAAILTYSYKCKQPGCNARKLKEVVGEPGAKPPGHGPPLLVFFGNHNHPITKQLQAEMLGPNSVIEEELAAGARLPRMTGAARVARTHRLQNPLAAVNKDIFTLDICDDCVTP